MADMLEERASKHDAESDCFALLHAHASDECQRIARALRVNRDLSRVALLGRPKRRGA